MEISAAVPSASMSSMALKNCSELTATGWVRWAEPGAVTDTGAGLRTTGMGARAAAGEAAVVGAAGAGAAVEAEGVDEGAAAGSRA